MNMNYDCVIVGCGLSGSVIARVLADQGLEVLVLDRRSTIAGNLYDYADEYGINIHKYGPHIFHTNSKDVYNYVLKYSEWTTYNLVCGAEIDGTIVKTPFNFATIDTYYSANIAKELKEKLLKKYNGYEAVSIIDLLNSNDEMILSFASFLLEKDYLPYAAKQWNKKPNEIDPSIFNRVPFYLSYDEGYFKDKYQLIPKMSYTQFVSNILNDDNITLKLDTPAREIISIKDKKINLKGMSNKIPVVYTGAIDELFSYIYGQLPYRTLKFAIKHSNQESYQSFPVVAYPQRKGYTRIAEYKKFTSKDVNGTTYVEEYPEYVWDSENAEPYYPILCESNEVIYRKYYEHSKNIKNLFLVGRLAEYRYYNMDQAISNSLTRSREILAYLDI